MVSRPVVPVVPPIDIKASIEEAIASTRLEGLEPTVEFVADSRLVASGDLDDDDLVARALARHRR